jgi:hypothetical protein
MTSVTADAITDNTRTFNCPNGSSFEASLADLDDKLFHAAKEAAREGADAWIREYFNQLVVVPEDPA